MAKGLACEHHIDYKTQIFPAQSQKNPMVSLYWQSFNNIWFLTLKLSNISMKSSKEGQRAIFSINPIIFIMMQSQIWLYSWFTWWMNVGLWGWPVHLLLWVWKVEEVRWFSFLLGFLIMGSTHLSEVWL